MDSISGMLNHIGKMPQTHYNIILKCFYWKKDNGILLETIGIYVIVSIGLLLFFFVQGLQWQTKA